MNAEAIIYELLEERIKQLLQINERIAYATDTAALEQQRLLIASVVYGLCTVQAEVNEQRKG